MMGLFASLNLTESLAPSQLLWSTLALIVAFLVYRIIYNLYFDPLARFPGPWYTSSFSVFEALISVRKREPEFLQSLVKKYGSTSRAFHYPITKARSVLTAEQ